MLPFPCCQYNYSLRSCIDYWALNSHETAVSSSPGPGGRGTLWGTQSFSKLDLRSAYNLVCIQEGDEWKALSSPLMATMSISLCRLAYPSSKDLWTRCSGSSSTRSSSFTLTIYSFTLRTWLTIAITWSRSYRGSVNTIYSSRWRSVNSIAPPCSSSYTSSARMESRWTRGM